MFHALVFFLFFFSVTSKYPYTAVKKILIIKKDGGVVTWLNFGCMGGEKWTRQFGEGN